jgi:ATP-binding cassette subfamily F protein 2
MGYDKKKKKPGASTTKKAPAAATAKTADQLVDDLTSADAVSYKMFESMTINGVLESQAQSKDIKIGSFSLVVFGKELVHDTLLEINYGRRYGLLGENGSGKSTILTAIASRQVPIPSHTDIWFVHEECKPSDLNAMESVIAIVKDEYARLEKVQETLLENGDLEEQMEVFELVMERMNGIELDKLEPRAAELLHGLGFTHTQMHKPIKSLSGGWRMRVALAQALFVCPTLLILDEPTNHLDLGACVWLENYLAHYPYTILMTSHSQDFLNGVCTNIMELTLKGELHNWSGNYDQYIQTKTELEKNQLTQYKKEQQEIKDIKAFINSCGTYANLRKQAESRQKVLDKMIAAGLTEKPTTPPEYKFAFPEAAHLASPVLAFNGVSFGYPNCEELYSNLEFGVDCDSRIALVGPNGVGKSTLLKLMKNELDPTIGEIKRHSHLTIGQYNQHSEEVLDLKMSPFDFFSHKYCDGVMTSKGKRRLESEEWREYLGRFGISGERQLRPIETLSNGLRSRLVFLMISLANPQILLLDEPTNNLDMGCIDSLAKAINNFTGGLVLVSHDFRLISQVAKEIWVVDNHTVSVWKGDIRSYKEHLKKDVLKKVKK